MTTDRLKALIAGGESLEVEFKSEASKRLSDGDLVEAVVCLANRPGTGHGWLLIGVEDDRIVSGARPRHEGDRTDLPRLQAMIANRTRPSLTVRAELGSVDEKDVLAIEVPASRQPMGTADGRYLRRVVGGDGKPACHPYHFHEMQSRRADSGLLDYTALPVPEVGWDALSPLEFDRFRRSIAENPGRGDEALPGLDNLDLAKALGAVETEGDRVVVRVLGLLLFGRQEALSSAVPTHEVAFQRLSQTDVETNDFFKWPLLRILEELELRFRSHNREQEAFVGMARIGIPDYPPRAFREGVANALVHRDYTRLGAVHVQWHDDRLEISSPGSFPEGINLTNLLVTGPRPRNPLLADAFKRAGIVERTARGIDTIFEAQLRSGRSVPSYERSTSAGVTLVLPGGQADLGFVRFIIEEERAGGSLGHRGLLLLHHLRSAFRVTEAEAGRVIQSGEASGAESLHALAERGLVTLHGRGGKRSYRLSDIVGERLLNDPNAPSRELTPAQQETRVELYALSEGKITRREVVDLCGIGPAQATRLLGRMVKKGLLKRHGKKRGTWYESARPNVEHLTGWAPHMLKAAQRE